MTIDISTLTRRALRKVYPRLGLRDTDILLASYPKSGNTWVRFIWANMVSLIERGGETVTFHTLTNELGSEYDQNTYGDIEFDCLPRLVKTHHEYSASKFEQNRSIYIIRHPGDVLISYYKYKIARKGSGISREDSLAAFIRSEQFGMPAWTTHVNSWLPEADVVIQYEDLKDGAAAVVASALADLGLADAVDDSVLAEAVRRSEFERMKEIEEEEGRPNQENFKDDFRFVRKGKKGVWEEGYRKRDKKYIREKLNSESLFQK
jgi:estrone sulfotransferase